MSAEPTPEERVRHHARACVRSGLLSTEEIHAEVVRAVTTELPDRADQAEALASTWLDEAREQLRDDQEGWPEATDHERLQSAFEEMELLDVVVLQGCEDQAAAQSAVDERSASGTTPAAVAWFTPADVWHAADEGMLAVRLRSGSSLDAAPDDELVEHVLSILEKHGLMARFAEGRLDIDAHWHKRIAT
jgi:hypothetical protein